MLPQLRNLGLFDAFDSNIPTRCNKIQLSHSHKTCPASDDVLGWHGQMCQFLVGNNPSTLLLILSAIGGFSGGFSGGDCSPGAPMLKKKVPI